MIPSRRITARHICVVDRSAPCAPVPRAVTALGHLNRYGLAAVGAELHGEGEGG